MGVFDNFLSGFKKNTSKSKPNAKVIAPNKVKEPNDTEVADAEVTNDVVKIKPELPSVGMHGFIGEVARNLSQGTEAISAFLAAELITYLSVAIKRGFVKTPYGAQSTVPRINALLVAKTGVGKGISSGQLKALKETLSDVSIMPQEHSGGLSSPEGLINAIKDDEGDESGQTEKGTKDKRLLVVEEEFANIIFQSSKPGSNLSTIIRILFDGGQLKPLTKYNQIGVREPHVAIFAHITPEELVARLQKIDLSNGFLNRFPIFFGSMQPSVPFVEPTCPHKIKQFAKELHDIVSWCNETPREFSMSDSYRNLWEEHYDRLRNLGGNNNQEKNLLTRARHYTTMYAMIFAATEKTTVMESRHLEAAMAWIEYWHDSIRYIYDTEFAQVEAEKAIQIANDVLNTIKGLVEKNGGGSIAKTPLTKSLSGRYFSIQINEALKYLQEMPTPAIKIVKGQKNKHMITLLQ